MNIRSTPSTNKFAIKIKNKKQTKKRKKSKSSRKRRYGSLTLVDTTNDQLSQSPFSKTPAAKKRKIDQFNVPVFPDHSEYTNANMSNTNQTNDAEEITEFNDDIFMTAFNDRKISSSNQANDKAILIDDEFNNKQTIVEKEKEEIIIPNDYEIDYSLIKDNEATLACKHHEKFIRYEQKQKYDEYKNHLKKLNAELNDKNKGKQVFEWKLSDYKYDDKQIITLINSKNKKHFQLQSEMLLFCSCSFIHNVIPGENKFENLLKNNQVLYGKIVEIQNRSQSISIRIKRYNKSLAEYDENANTAANENEIKIPFHNNNTCLFRIELDEFLFSAFGLQLKAIETFFSSTTIQLGKKWCSKYYYINDDNSNSNEVKPLLTTNDLLKAVESCQLIKVLSFPMDLTSCIVNFIGEHDQYIQIKDLNQKLNDSQIKAIYNGCNHDVSLIQGPPGTGKTFTAVHIVKKSLLNKQCLNKIRILLTAHTHAACDQLLSELHNRFQNESDLNITRFSNPSQIKIIDLKEYSHRNKMKQHSRYHEMLRLFAASRNKHMSAQKRQEILTLARSLESCIIGDVLKESQIIVSTCYGCCKSVLAKSDIRIDVIIIDEATQIIESEMLGVFNLLQQNRGHIEDIKYWKRRYNSEKRRHAQRMEEKGCEMDEDFGSIYDKQYGFNDSSNRFSAEFYTYIGKIKNFNKKVVMIGDPAQLSPVIRSKEAQKCGYVFFDRLLQKISMSQLIQCSGNYNIVNCRNKYKLNNFIMLNTQYRGYALCGHEFCSNQFYNGQVKHSPIWKEQRLIGGFKWKNNKPFNFVCIDSKQTMIKKTYQNEKEADYIIRILKGIMDYGLYSKENRTDTIKINDFQDIGIITPHTQQASLLQKKFNDEYGWASKNLLAISTVDAFQGQQKSLIIYSMTRTDAACNKFTRNHKRINVSLTRAKHGLIIVGNPVQFGGFKVWRELEAYLSDKDLIKNNNE